MPLPTPVSRGTSCLPLPALFLSGCAQQPELSGFGCGYEVGCAA